MSKAQSTPAPASPTPSAVPEKPVTKGVPETKAAPAPQGKQWTEQIIKELMIQKDMNHADAKAYFEKYHK